MQRMDFHRDDFVSSFRREGLTPDTHLPNAPQADAPPAVNDCRSAVRWTSTLQSPRRQKKRIYPWQLLFYIPWMLWMFGHDLWRSHHPAPNTALIQAAQDGNLAQVTSALAHGASINAECGCNRSALSWASSKGHIAVASFLLSKGAAVNPVDRDGDSALTLAAWQGHTDVVALLVAHHADVNHINGKGGSALWSAVQHQQADMARILLSHKANPNAGGQRGWTMLMDAARSGSLPMVTMLLAHGARVDARSLDGETAYGEALLQHRADIAAVLQKAGAVPTATAPATWKRWAVTS